ncbi:MAG: hypothetical protein ABIP95_15765 [Pelobium sp.]
MNSKYLEEDEIPFEEILNKVSDNSDDVLRVIDAMNLGRSHVKDDGVYRVFNDGSEIKIEAGSFSKKKLFKKTYKL